MQITNLPIPTFVNVFVSILLVNWVPPVYPFPPGFPIPILTSPSGYKYTPLFLGTGNVNIPESFDISNSEPLLLYYDFNTKAFNFGDLSKGSIRIHLALEDHSKISDSDLRCPILATIRMPGRISNIQVPVQLYNGTHKISYVTAGTTICLQDSQYSITKIHQLWIQLNTCGEDKKRVRVLVTHVENEAIRLGVPREITVSPTESKFYRFVFTDYNRALRMVTVSVSTVGKNTDAQPCSTVSVQHLQCPVYDKSTNVDYGNGYQQTVRTTSDMTISRDDFPDGFFIVLVVHGSEDRCLDRSPEIMVLDKDAVKLVDNSYRKNTFQLTVNLHLSPEDYGFNSLKMWNPVVYMLSVAIFLDIVFGLLGFCLCKPEVTNLCKSASSSWDKRKASVTKISIFKCQDQSNLARSENKCLRCCRWCCTCLQTSVTVDQLYETQEISQIQLQEMRNAASRIQNRLLQKQLQIKNDCECDLSRMQRELRMQIDANGISQLSQFERQLQIQRKRIHMSQMQREFQTERRSNSETELQIKEEAEGIARSAKSESELQVQVDVKRIACRSLSESELPRFETQRRLNFVFNIERNVEIQRKFEEMSRHSNSYCWLMIILSLFYIIPAFQLLINWTRVVHTTGEHDLCYFNYKCSHPKELWGMKLLDFNGFISNISYWIMGFYFMLTLTIRICFFRYNESSDSAAPRKGVIEQFGTFYALGFSIVMEGVMSAAYHICPNKENFPFDTSFMYVIAVVTFVKIYEFRHTKRVNVFLVFFGLALASLLSMLSVRYPFKIKIIVTVLHGFATLLLPLPCVRNVVYEKLPPMKNYRPHNCLHIVLFVLANLILIVCLWVKEEIGRIPFYLLITLVVNTGIYLVIYLIMKLCHGECCPFIKVLENDHQRNHERNVFIWIQPLIFLIFTGICFGKGWSYFSHPQAEWEKTASDSRAANQDCEDGFYDGHDMWHFWSAAGLYSLLMFLLTLDKALRQLEHSEIHVF